MTSKSTLELEEKIKNKLTAAEELRLEKLNSITERLKEHVNYFVGLEKIKNKNDLKAKKLTITSK